MLQVTVRGTVYQYQDPFEGCEGNHPQAMEGAIGYMLRDGGIAGSTRVACDTNSHVAKVSYQFVDGQLNANCRIEIE